MKKTTLLFCLLAIPAIAAAPDTTCPSGYIAVNASNTTIAETCPTGTVSVGTASSCLAASPGANCIMYAPAGVSYTDEYGTYEFTEACVLQ